MNYFELREKVKRIVPRKSLLEQIQKTKSYVKEKGRKVNYRQFNIDTGGIDTLQRLLNKDEIHSFIEISLRAAHCPMPLNLDLADGIRCGFACQYCFADVFRASLYTSFFDNWKEIGYRFCRPDYFIPEMDKLMKCRDQNPQSLKNDLQKAIALEIPLRFGIRFEDFLPIESKVGVSLAMLKYLQDHEYPVMINTKSDLVGKGEYLKALADNKAKAAVHITLLSSDESFLKEMEPGAPSFKRRLEAAEALVQAGVRVVARIEPFMVFINDEKDKVDEYIGRIKEVGIKNVTLDTYSYSAGNVGIRRNFESMGWDFERMFGLMSDCQWMGSLLLGKFMDYLREGGLSCSTFDFGNVPTNDQLICCEVTDWFKGFSYGNTTVAIRYIVSRGEKPTTWQHYEKFVDDHGGFLSDALRMDVKMAWNLVGNRAFFPDWAQGVEMIGQDSLEGNRIWRYNKSNDFREQFLQIIL